MTNTTTILDFLRELPKCEHHVHLEGTLSPELLLTLAERNKIKLPDAHPQTANELYDRYSKFSCLQDFLDHYYVGMSVLVSQQDFEDLAWNYFVKAQQDGVHHAEVFFDPQAHVERGISFAEVVDGITAARDRAHKELGISTKLIMCFLRHLTPEAAHETLQMARPHMEKGQIAGIGLDSSEKGRPAELFTEVYAAAREFHFDVNFTAHAGEEGDFSYVEGALDHLRVSRIDHGVRSVECKATLARLAKDQTLLTVCPMSNLKLRGVDCISKVPLRQLLEADVPFSINSDDPAYFGGYILDNYLEVQKHFEFDVDTWCKIAHNSIKGSWLGDNRKAALQHKVELVREKYVEVSMTIN